MKNTAKACTHIQWTKQKVQSLQAECNRYIFKQDIDDDCDWAHFTSFGKQFQIEAKENKQSQSYA